jgi:hypothetical protein
MKSRSLGAIRSGGRGFAIRHAAALACALLASCGTTIREKHYFAAFTDAGLGAREPVQFYRVRVEGTTSFSNTRYLTGYFDERAVSLFFNEIKAPSDQKLFDDARAVPGLPTGTKLTPLSPTPENGAFVLIMSTNADAVASAIGSFAESQAVADAMTRLLNRDRVRAKVAGDATLAVHKAEGAGLAAQVRAQIDTAAAAGSGDLAAAAYLRALTALARGLGYGGDDFATADQARAWFNLEASRPQGS